MFEYGSGLGIPLKVGGGGTCLGCCTYFSVISQILKLLISLSLNIPINDMDTELSKRVRDTDVQTAVDASASGAMVEGISGLPYALIQSGHWSLPDAQAALLHIRLSGGELAEKVVADGLISAVDLAILASRVFGYPLIYLPLFDPSRLLHALIETRTIQEHRVIVLSRRGNRLLVAMPDPTSKSAIEKIQFQTSLVVSPVVAQVDHLISFIATLHKKKNEEKATNKWEPSNNAMFSDDDDSVVVVKDGDVDDEDAIEDAPVVQFVNKALMIAVEAGASDLHFEPYEKFYRVRMRVDGVLREMEGIPSLPLSLKEKISARVKVISSLDIAERRVPQDGCLKVKIAGKSIGFRVSTLPTLFGEKMVLRVLDQSGVTLGFKALGYEPIEQERMVEAISSPHGMVLVTGPTGSGKTVSLYTCLHLLNKPGVNIATAEDPSEINLPGINQVNINEKAGLTFPVALRSFLRQDPDIVMIGEIRDYDTADIAIKVAQTGHLVLSTLHTNDAPATLTRLMNMGVAPFNIASSVILITAQRLARRLCHCKKPIELPAEVLLAAGFTEEALSEEAFQLFAPVGCDRCSGLGYKGRVGIYQVMPISDQIQRIILRQGDIAEIVEQSRHEGVFSLRESGLRKVKNGLTSLEEILSLTGE